MNQTPPSTAPDLTSIILAIRDQRVILDANLARIYGVQTRALNQAVKRNLEKFPEDFMFELRREEILRISQTVTSLRKLKFSKQVRAFTEHGALMAATVLNSPLAVKMSLFIIRAFVKMREENAAHAAILKRLAEIDKSLLTHDAALRDLYQKLRPLLAPPPERLKPEIGFHVKEEAAPYRVKRKSVLAT
ncbi:MAG: ORF6N domain-containing protein [Limisphaerales bacterium]